MKKIEMISGNVNYSAITIGNFDQIGEHLYVISPDIKVPGKVFIGDALQCTGTEVSFQMMPPKMSTPFYHTHKDNEELYVVIKGCGEFQVDDNIFPISEGSAIKIAPAGKRTWQNTSNEPMIMMVIQSKANSLKELGITDGFICKDTVRW